MNIFTNQHVGKGQINTHRVEWNLYTNNNKNKNGNRTCEQSDILCPSEMLLVIDTNCCIYLWRKNREEGGYYLGNLCREVTVVVKISRILLYFSFFI